MRISEDNADQLALKILAQVLQHRQGGAGQRGIQVGIADIGKVNAVGRDMPLPGAPPRRQDRVPHLARLDGLRCQEPCPGPGQPAVTGHLRPHTRSARHARPPSATAAITGPAGTLAGPGALLPDRWPGSPPAARRPHRAGPRPGDPRPRGRQRRSLSLCHRFRIRSRQARDLARRLAIGTDSLSRMRGTASAMTTAMAKPTACAPAVAPDS